MKKFFFIVVFFSTSVLGVITPPSFFYQQWITQTKIFQNILIKQERQIVSQGVVTQTINETIKIKRPGLYKSTSIVDGFENVRVVGKTRAMLGTTPNLRQVKLEDVITPLDASILYAQAGTLESVLNQIAVDNTQYALELFNHEPLIRAGAKNGNRIYISSSTNNIQAMVYKNLRYQFKYDTTSSFQSYPSDIEIYDGDTLKEKIRVTSVSTNAKISESEFEIK